VGTVEGLVLAEEVKEWGGQWVNGRVMRLEGRGCWSGVG